MHLVQVDLRVQFINTIVKYIYKYTNVCPDARHMYVSTATKMHLSTF